MLGGMRAESEDLVGYWAALDTYPLLDELVSEMRLRQEGKPVPNALRVFQGQGCLEIVVRIVVSLATVQQKGNMYSAVLAPFLEGIELRLEVRKWLAAGFFSDKVKASNVLGPSPLEVETLFKSFSNLEA